MEERFKFDNDLIVPKNFTPTAPLQTYPSMRFIPELEVLASSALSNPQTEQFCSWLGISMAYRNDCINHRQSNVNPEEIPMDDLMAAGDEGIASTQNPEEIPVDNEDDFN